MTDASLQPHWLPDVQNWAIDQERQRHLDAVYAYGEYAVFVLMWRVQDFEAGLVGRCKRCYLSQGKIAEVYGQGKQNKCPDCFGTTFEGGYRARIIRPALWDHDSTEQHGPRPRGDTFQANARVQTTDDFNLNTDDYVFRADGTRWQIAKTDWDLLHTGFGFPDQFGTLVGWNLTSVNLEDESSVAYLIPPTPDDVEDILTLPQRFPTRYPMDFSQYEDIRGPLDVAPPEEDDDDEHGEGIENISTTDSVTRLAVHTRAHADGSVATDASARMVHRSRATANGAATSDAASASVISPPHVVWALAGYKLGHPVVTTMDDFTYTGMTTPNDNIFPGAIGICAAHVGGLWVVGTTDGILTSPDALTWSRPDSPFDGVVRGEADGRSCHGIAGNGSLWVAVGQQNDGSFPLAATSPDAVTWTQRTIFPADHIVVTIYCVAYGAGLWVAGGYDGDGRPGTKYALYTSPDGITWTPCSSPMDDHGVVYGIAWNGSMFVAVGQDNQHAKVIITSPDGINWTYRPSPFDSTDGNGGFAYGVCWSPALSLWVAVGYHPNPGNVNVSDRTIATSPDGINWTDRPNGFNLGQPVTAVAWNGTEFKAVAQDGRVGTSTDGVTWFVRSIGTIFLGVAG